LEQPFIKNPEILIKDLLTSRIASLGENIKVRRFSRLEIGAE
jgi:elongation factor Ts